MVDSEDDVDFDNEACGLRTKQVDYSNAFVQADIDGDVYCELQTEFSLADGGKSDYDLKFKKSLC